MPNLSELFKSTDFVPRFKSNIGSRYFSVAAPTLWNSLSDDVESVNTIMTFSR